MNPLNLDEYDQRSLYSFQNEHDSCGVGLVVNISGEKSHEIIENGMQEL
jgi:glutamate synthase (NADPH/NADH) large chain